MNLGELIAPYTAQQYAVLLTADVQLRLDLAGVHRTRVAIRRYRSVLRVFADVFDPDAATRLDRELAWYGAVLGAARDVEVLRGHLRETVRDAPVPEHVIARIDEHLRDEHAAATRQLRAQLNGARYRALLADVEAAQCKPPFTPVADQPADRVDRYLAAATKTLRRRLDRAAAADATDELLHSTRKAAKRARYAAELAAEEVGKPARRLVRKATALQQLLGEHHDTVVARSVLRQLADADADTETTFSLGVLWERENRQAGKLHRQVRKVKLP